MKPILTLLLPLLLALPLAAQLEVQEHRIGIGAAPSYGAALRVYNDQALPDVLTLDNYGSHATVARGLRIQNRAATAKLFGVEINTIRTNPADHQNVRAVIVSYNVHGSSNIYGIYNSGYGFGTGHKVGMYTYVGDNYANGGYNKDLIGSKVRVYTDRRLTTFGHYTELENKDQTNPNKKNYGYYFHAKGNGGGDTYGVYSCVSPGQGYAGYFDGNIMVTGTTCNVSDERLKRNILDLTGAGNILNRLRPRAYYFAPTPGVSLDTEHQQYGFLAQEVEAIAPDLVMDVVQPPTYGPAAAAGGGSARDSSEHLDSELTELLPAATLKGIRYQDLIALLVRGYQEQDLRLDSLFGLLPDLDLGLGLGSRAPGTAPAAPAPADDELTRQLLGDVDALRAEVTALRAELAALRRCTDCGSGDTWPPLGTPAEGYGFYPNPADDQLRVSGPAGQDLRIRLFSPGGRLLRQQPYAGGGATLSTADLPAGNYRAEITGPDGAVLLRQVIVVVH